MIKKILLRENFHLTHGIKIHINSDWRLVISTTSWNNPLFHLRHNPKALGYRLCIWHQAPPFQALAGTGNGLDTPTSHPTPTGSELCSPPPGWPSSQQEVRRPHSVGLKLRQTSNSKRGDSKGWLYPLWPPPSSPRLLTC